MMSWRDLYPVHPCADKFPMMSDTELDELAKDITANGLREPVVVWRADALAGTPLIVLDGRNRLAALARLRAQLPRLDSDDDNEVMLPDGTVHRPLFTYFDTDDPAAYVISVNIRRRHLTKEQRAELIVKTIEAAKNDRATVARSFSPTPSKKGGSTKDPVLAKAVTEAAKHGISKRTVQNARAKLKGKPKSARVSKREVEAAHAEARKLQDDVAKHNRHLLDEASAALYASERAKLLRAKDGTAAHHLALRVIDTGYKAVARDLHPDKGGSTEAMARLNAVRDHLKKCV